jgi:putative RNA 2'-phosphotransferase
MDRERLKRLGKWLSWILRHEPGAIGLELDPQGWASVDALLQCAQEDGKPLTRETLKAVVAADSKQRFAFSSDEQRIRASQGHSVDVDLGLTPKDPPEILYQGTVDRFLDSIREHGLLKQSRHHVHLSDEVDTAQAVGSRRGKPVVLEVEARRMASNGHLFYQSDNGVWLTDHVPPEYIRFP